MNTAQRWAVCLAIASMLSCLGLVYFINDMSEKSCLESGGRWLSLIQGCEGGNSYSMQYLTSPLAIAIFMGIILGITSALFQIYTLLILPIYNKYKD
jgi:hypothetical protein